MLVAGRSKATLSGLGASGQIYPLGYCEQPSKPCEASSLSPVHTFLKWQSDMLLRSCAGAWGEMYLTFEGQNCPGWKMHEKSGFCAKACMCLGYVLDEKKIETNFGDGMYSEFS